MFYAHFHTTYMRMVYDDCVCGVIYVINAPETVEEIAMNNRIVKLYAAYRSGCLNENIFHAYYSLLANIILNDNWDDVNEALVAEKFYERYKIPVKDGFVCQILGVGVERKEIIYENGRYHADRAKLRSYRIDNHSFEQLWKRLKDGFTEFCANWGFDCSRINVEESILRFLDAHDVDVLSLEEFYVNMHPDKFGYFWSNYLKQLSEESPKLFDFVVSISISNIMKETIFYTSNEDEHENTFSGLNIYLDSPIVFALLGMDSQARIDSCKMLVKDMVEAGCSVYVFDSNFTEVMGIMERAAGWAIDANYSLDKANNATRFFHDILEADTQKIAEFIVRAESRLNELSVTIKKTSYDFLQDSFQEDEHKLNAMIEEAYERDGRAIPDEKKRGIAVDVRAIVMIYRERCGYFSTQIQLSRHIFITLNGAIANVSKNYEAQLSINAGHIPACVSADLFGSVLWLFSPSKQMEYHRKQLLADCYVALRPSRDMLNKYIEHLANARATGEIDERTFLFLRANPAVNDALMNVTKGDYARFNANIHREVIQEIEAKANKKYEEVNKAHDNTKQHVATLTQENEKLERMINDLQARIDTRDEADFDKKCKRWSRVFTLVVVGLPLIIVHSTIEILKSNYNELSAFSMLKVGIYVFSSLIATAIYFKGKEWICQKTRNHLTKRRTKSPH